MSKKQYQFKVTITLEEGDDYTQDYTKGMVEDYLRLGCDDSPRPTSYNSIKVEPINVNTDNHDV